MPAKTPPRSLVQRRSAAVHRIGRLGFLAVALAATGCAGPAAGTPAASSVAASPSASEAETPIPTLETTSKEAAEAPAGAITVTVGPGPDFVPGDITAPAGTVVFFLDARPADIVHNMVIAINVGDVPLAKSANLEAGQAVIFTVHGLEPGTYEFWCSFAGHLEAGMKGTLTVT